MEEWGYECNLKLDFFATQGGRGGQGRGLVERTPELFRGFDQCRALRRPQSGFAPQRRSFLGSNMHTPPRITASRRNLSRRPLKPAAARGRVQVLCRRALLTHGGQISTTTAIAWSYRALTWGAPSKNDFNRSVRRALISIGAKRIGRARTRGRPWIWALDHGAKHG
jgi:hypothetical protein